MRKSLSRTKCIRFVAEIRPAIASFQYIVGRFSANAMPAAARKAG